MGGSVELEINQRQQYDWPTSQYPSSYLKVLSKIRCDIEPEPKTEWKNTEEDGRVLRVESVLREFHSLLQFNWMDGYSYKQTVDDYLKLIELRRGAK